MGFEIKDAIVLLCLDKFYIETFEVNDTKTLKGEHFSRAIGRLTGKRGNVKKTIENSTKTRILLMNTKIHIIGEFQNISIARHAICQLIIGYSPGKIYTQLRIML